MADMPPRLLAILLIVATPAPAPAKNDFTAASQFAVCLRISPALALSVSQTATMVSEANAVWERHGITIREGSDDGCRRLIEIKSDREAYQDDTADRSALAWVLFVKRQPRQLVFVRVDRARDMLEGLGPGTRPEGLTDLLVARLVGRSVAHELGHILLNTPTHSRAGLMREQFRAQDVLSAKAADYTLDRQQRARLITNIAAATRLANR